MVSLTGPSLTHVERTETIGSTGGLLRDFVNVVGAGNIRTDVLRFRNAPEQRLVETDAEPKTQHKPAAHISPLFAAGVNPG